MSSIWDQLFLSSTIIILVLIVNVGSNIRKKLFSQAYGLNPKVIVMMGMAPYHRGTEENLDSMLQYVIKKNCQSVLPC